MTSPMGLAVLPGENKKDALYVPGVYRLHQLDGLTGKETNVFKGDLLNGAGNLTTAFTLSADGENLIVSSWFGAVGQSGDIYVSGGGKNVIYRISKN